MQIRGILSLLNGLGLAAVLAVLAGCHPGGGGAGGPGGGRTMTREELHTEAVKNTETNVLRVIAYYQPPYRWIWTEDKERVRGLVIGALYLEGPGGKGVFGNGVIRAKLFVRNRAASAPGERYRVTKEWEFTPEDTLLLRTKRPTIQGNGYMLPLNWEDLGVDLGGQEIRIVINYERIDGIHVPASTKDLIVPGRGP